MNSTKARMAAGVGAMLLVAALPGAANAKHKPRRANLVVSSITKPPATSAGSGTLKVTVKVKNRGKATAKASKVGLYLATGKKHKSSDLRLARKSVKKLKKGKTATVKITATLPAVTAAVRKAGPYRLIACADDTKKVKESSEKDNCKASSVINLTAPVVTPPPPPPPAAATPAFTLTDGVDWGFVEFANNNSPVAGDPITATLTASNAVAGSAGYTRSVVAAEPLVTGTTTTFDYSGLANSTDDGAAPAVLPFAFPFGGIAADTTSVGTNGWIGFGAPAWDYWDDNQLTDYRGTTAILTRFVRGIMPYLGDLDVADQGAGTGTVKMVVPAGAGSVAFQWDLGQHVNPGAPRRTLQLVLYPDGRYRLDYPGTNAAGGSTAFVGSSLGTDASGFDQVALNTTAVPAGGSVLYTPKPVTKGLALPAGSATLTLPADSSFLSADPGCVVTTAPTATVPGVATCAFPAIPAGQQVAKSVTFGTPGNAPGQTNPANFKLAGTYHSGAFSLGDDTEVDLLQNNLRSTTITLTPAYTSPTPPAAGNPALFTVPILPVQGGLDEPTVTFTLPASTVLDSVKILGDDVDCDAPAAGQVHCRLPSGLRNGSPTGSHDVLVTVTPGGGAVGHPMTLGVTAQALNAPAVTQSASSPDVTP